MGWTVFAIVLIAIGIVALGSALRSLFLVSEAVDRLERENESLVRDELQHQREAIDSLADGLDVAIFMCDRKANILYANRQAIQMFAFPDPIGRTILAVTLSYDLEQFVLDVGRTGESQATEMIFAYPGDRIGRIHGWPEPSGQRVFLTIYEITDLRRLERVRQDFVANVSHELRTPLATIRAMSETLLDDDTDDQDLKSRYLEKVISEVDRLSLLTNDLLVLTTAELNPVRKQRCNLADVLRSVVAQLEPKAREKSLALNYEGPIELMADANAGQMTQVFLNLIDNALNYTAEGKVEVQLKATKHSAEISIRDTGIGMASEHINRIFERFYRIDRGRSRATGGTGLGLSIVKHIVEAHGGTVQVESTLNQGSTFTVTLPLS